MHRLLRVVADESIAGKRQSIYDKPFPRVGSVGPGGLLLGKNGKPLLDKDGFPLTSHPWMSDNGVVIDRNRNLVLGADKQPLRIDPKVRPGESILDVKGRVVLGEDGRPLKSDPRQPKHIYISAPQLVESAVCPV